MSCDSTFFGKDPFVGNPAQVEQRKPERRMHEGGPHVHAQQHAEPDEVDAQLLGDRPQQRQDDEGNLEEIEKEHQKENEVTRENVRDPIRMNTTIAVMRIVLSMASFTSSTVSRRCIAARKAPTAPMAPASVGVHTAVSIPSKPPMLARAAATEGSFIEVCGGSSALPKLGHTSFLASARALREMANRRDISAVQREVLSFWLLDALGGARQLRQSVSYHRVAAGCALHRALLCLAAHALAPYRAGS